MQWIKINEISTIYVLHWCSLTKQKQNYKHLKDKKSYQLINMSGLFTISCSSAKSALEKVEQTFKLTINPVRTVAFSCIHQIFCCFLRYHVSPWPSICPVTEEERNRNPTQEAFHGNPAVSSLSVDFLRKGRPQMPSGAWAACDHKTRVSLTQGRREWRGQNMCLPACPSALSLSERQNGASI